LDRRDTVPAPPFSTAVNTIGSPLHPAAEDIEALRELPVGQRPGVVESPRLPLKKRGVVDRVEKVLFSAPVTSVPGDQSVLEDQLHVVEGRHHRDRPMGVLHRDAVPLGVELHQ
jgi:hypothetical protein